MLIPRELMHAMQVMEVYARVLASEVAPLFLLSGRDASRKCGVLLEGLLREHATLATASEAWGGGRLE